MKKQTKKQTKQDNTIILAVIVVVLLIIFCIVYNVKYRSVNGRWGWMHMYGSNNGLFGAGDRDEENEWGVRNMMNWQDNKEANLPAKTAEETFNESKSLRLMGTSSEIISEQIEKSIKGVFGDVKPITFSGEYLGEPNSFLVTFKTPRLITEADADKLIAEFSKNGYSDGTKTITVDSTSILINNRKVTITISYPNSGSQEINVLYMEKLYE